MEDLKQKTETLTHDVEDYIETYIKLSALKATDKAAGIASVSVTAILVLTFTVLVLLFLGFGLGWWIGENMNNMLAGFAIVAGIYLLLTAIVVLFRKNLLLPLVRNIIIKIAYE
jgi:hypothetical protein